MDLLVGVEVIHTSKASQTQLLNHSWGYKLHWMQMCSVCRTSAAAALSRRALPTKHQPGLLVRLLFWEFGDLGSTLCEAQPHQEPQGTQSVRGGWQLETRRAWQGGTCWPEHRDVLGAVPALLCPICSLGVAQTQRQHERGKVSVLGLGWTG